MNKPYRAGVMAVMLFAGCTTGHRKVGHTSGAEPGYKTPRMVALDDLMWIEEPEGSGILVATLTGDPKRGPFTRMQVVPADTDYPLHAHSSEITTVIIRGYWYTGLNEESAVDYGPGSVVTIPSEWAHVSGCRAGANCLLYQQGDGPFE